MNPASDREVHRRVGHNMPDRVRRSVGGSSSLRRVPEVTVYFWIIKVLTTAVGEATSDYARPPLRPGRRGRLRCHRPSRVARAAVHAAPIRAVGLLARRASWSRCSARWPPTCFTSSSGSPTSYRRSFFAVVLAVGLRGLAQQAKGPSRSTASPRRREIFYWATVGSTFALGTAAGDMTATTLHLGYFFSGVLFAGLIAVPALAYRFLDLNAIVVVLVRLHRDPAARCILRRLDGQAAQLARPGLGRRTRECGVEHLDRRLRRLFDGHPARRRRAR